MHQPFVSVVIPVYNDVTRLAHCLQALHQQTYSRYEIIVVDNNSSEDIEALTQQFPQVRYCFEPKPGNNAARNRGIAASQGEIIAITDADCIPDAKWLAEGVRAIQAGQFLIGGAIQFFYQAARPNVVEYADKLSYLRQQDYITQEHYAAGANLFVHRMVLEKVGLFDERLLNLGDKEFCQRAYEQGFTVSYCPAAMVWHPARSTVRALLSKARRQSRASVRLARLKGTVLPNGSFSPLGRQFFRAVMTDPNLPHLHQKFGFIAVIHLLKWAIAYELLLCTQHQNLDSHQLRSQP